MTVNSIEPAPRRVRGVLGGVTVVDTVAARYVWEEGPPYPAYYVPVADLAPGVLADEGRDAATSRGTARRHGLTAGFVTRRDCVGVHSDGPLAGYARIAFSALDAWFEEDEQIFVHPRDPYSRVDALRSTRRVRVSLEGVVLAESSSPVILFETGLPPRYYLNRTEVDLAHLIPSKTVTSCPYKGTTSAYWSVRVGEAVRPDLAWSYDFPRPGLEGIAGLICFYDEKVDIALDGVPQERPATHFS